MVSGNDMMQSIFSYPQAVLYRQKISDFNNMEDIYMEKRYRLDFYDMFDGWIYRDIGKSENDFEILEDAMAERDIKNIELPESNKKSGEHYGVIDLLTKEEICCPMEI